MTDTKRTTGRDSDPGRGLEDRRGPENTSGAAPQDGRRRSDGSRAPGDGAERRGRRNAFDPEKGRGPEGAARALIELDRDLMKLLVRRAKLVSRIRNGREHASGPAAVQAEKAVRIAWETGALAFSKDPKFSRQLFSLLQDIKIMEKEEAENAGSFNLSPKKAPVSGCITGPTSVRTAQMRLFLAASLGSGLHLEPLMFSSALNDTCQVCEQAGSVLRRGGNTPASGSLTLEPGTPITHAGKSLFLGDDAFTAYLQIFFSLARPGVSRLNGGAGLKNLDFSPLRHTLPLFGARLAHVVPQSNGLPANLECSGSIPPHAVMPAEFPPEALSALLLAPLAWNTPVTLDLAALPAATVTAALAEVSPLHKDSGAEVESCGPRISFTPAPLHLEETPALPLDPVLASYLLAIPAFSGGSLEMKGVWPSYMPEAAEAEQLFAWAGLEFKQADGTVRTRLISEEDPGNKTTRQRFSLPMQCDDVSAGLGPLFLVLSSLYQRTSREAVALSSLLAYPESGDDTALTREFFERLGHVFEGGVLSEGTADADAVPSWTSPSPHWSLAYALAAFLKPGLKLANPGSVSTVMPLFWGVYNSLPNAVDGAGSARKKGEKNDGPPRRRIIAE